MPTLEEDLHTAAAKVMEALEERSRRAWRLGVKPEDTPIGISLAKAFSDWAMINNVMRNPEPEPEPEEEPEEEPAPVGAAEPEEGPDPEPPPKWTSWTGSAGVRSSVPKPLREVRRQALGEALEVQRRAIEEALVFVDGRVSEAAVVLDIPLSTLYYKLHRFGISFRG